MNDDLRNAPYEQIVDFVFDHYPEDEVDDKWYWQHELDVRIEPREAVAFLTRLCNNAGDLVNRFTLRQIAEGVNFVFGAGARYEFGEQLWNPTVPWPERRACIRSIPRLYSQVFERDPDGIGGCAFMLWDSIAYGYCCGNRHPDSDAEDARVQDAMFEALVSMLRSDHPETLRGAIHGLGHLEHREGNRVLRELLSSSRALGPAVRQYAAQVLEGHFQ
jgi:hypothetical protein